MKSKEWLENFIKKHWNKVDLIEYFIETLGDNEILGKFMSKEQIRGKLNSVISNVMWANNDFFTKHAGWNSGEQVLVFNRNSDYISEENIETIIVHEMLHALSTSYSKDNSSTIISKKIGIDNLDLSEKSYNTGANEGITQGLAEEITGYHDYRNGYRYETDEVYKKLCILIGRDEIVRVYLEDINNMDYLLPNEIFKDSIINKFEVLGDTISNEVSRILALTDIITNYRYQTNLNNNSKACMQKCKDEIDRVFTKIYKVIIEDEHDLLKKTQKLCKYSVLSGEQHNIELQKLLKFISKSEVKIDNSMKIDIFNKLYKSELSSQNKNLIIDTFLSSTVNNEKKIEMLREWTLNAESIEKIVKSDCISSMQVSEKVNFILDNRLNYWGSSKLRYDSQVRPMLYDLCVQGKMITDNNFKRTFLLNDLVEWNSVTNSEELNDNLKKIGYQKIGKYYRICKVGEFDQFDEYKEYWYDKNGERFKLDEIPFLEIKLANESIEDRQDMLQEDLPNANWTELEKAISNCEKQFKENQEIEPNERVYNRIYNIDNMCIIRTSGKKMGKRINTYEYYSIDENGKMIRIEPRS